MRRGHQENDGLTHADAKAWVPGENDITDSAYVPQPVTPDEEGDTPVLVWPTALGAGMIALGGAAIASFFLSLLGLAIRDAITPKSTDYSSSMETGVPVFKILLSILLVLAHVWTLVAGRLLVHHRPNARKHCLAAAIAVVVCSLAQHAAFYSRYPRTFFSGYMIIGQILLLLRWLALPVFLLCWFLRNSIRYQTSTWEVAPPKRPSPVWPETIGVVVIMFVGGFLAQLPACAFYYGTSLFTSLLELLASGRAPFLGEWDWIVLAEMAQAFGAIPLLIAGILLLFRRPWAGILTRIAVIAMIVLILGEMTVYVIVSGTSQYADAFVSRIVHNSLAKVPWIALIGFLLYWLSKRSIRREILSWKLARQQETGLGEES